MTIKRTKIKTIGGKKCYWNGKTWVRPKRGGGGGFVSCKKSKKTKSRSKRRSKRTGRILSK